jgi:hypothetical protein
MYTSSGDSGTSSSEFTINHGSPSLEPYPGPGLGGVSATRVVGLNAMPLIVVVEDAGRAGLVALPSKGKC